ncbi:MAG TPA: endo-1,4-beta-xylanase [Polyangiaceae bacterium]|nr:endo-1,4-beta-xylanase [Polyangiaceae bacterium]
MHKYVSSFVALIVGHHLAACAGSDSGSGPNTDVGASATTTAATDATATVQTVTSGATVGGTGVGESISAGISASTSGIDTSSGGAPSTGSSTSTGASASTGTSTTDGTGGDPSTSGVGGVGGTQTSGGGSGGSEPCVVDHGGEIPALKEYYADHFAMGAAIDTRYNDYMSLLTKHYNSVTAEDQMKFDALQPSEGTFSYGTADQMVDFALANGMQVRGHALVWHRQTPSWVFSGSSAQVLERMRNHITNVMQHFQGKVKVWDVVNEAIMDDGTYRTNDEGENQSSGWYGALGESYIAEAFIAARAADPEAKLFYNDYYNYHPVRRQAIYEMLERLIAADVPIDGVGLQAHLNLAPGTDPEEQSYHQTVENMEQAIEMYASLGLDVQITEMDISLYLRGISYTEDQFYTPEKVTAEVLAEQAERYREFFDMFREHSDVISSVTTWGISDDNTWLSEFDSGRQDFPLLFDGDQQPKPAFWAVVDFCN